MVEENKMGQERLEISNSFRISLDFIVKKMFECQHLELDNPHYKSLKYMVDLLKGANYDVEKYEPLLHQYEEDVSHD